MKTANTRLAAVLLALVMIFTILPVAGFANGEPPADPTEGTTETTAETTTTEATTTTEDPAEEATTAPTEAATDPVEGEVLAAAAGDVGTFALDSNSVIDIGGESDLRLNVNHTNPAGDACECGETHDVAGWSWDKDNDTLTLTGYTSPNPITIDCDPGDTVYLKLEGTSKFSTNEDYGIYCAGSLVISGGGSVNVEITAVSGEATGIKADGEVRILSGTVTATAANTYDSGSGGIVGKTVAITGGRVTATGANGIFGDSAVTISDGTVNATANYDSGYGIMANNVTLSGGSGTIMGGATEKKAVLATTGGLTLGGDVDALGSHDGSNYNIAPIIYIDTLNSRTYFVDSEQAPLRYIRFGALPSEPEPEPAPDSKPQRPSYTPSYDDDVSDSESTYTRPPVVADDWLDPDEARPLAASSKRQNLDYARTFRATRYGVRGKSWVELAGLRFYHDTMLSGAVQVRVTFDNPSLFSEDARVSGYVTGARVDLIRGVFEKRFVNPVRTIHFDQTGEWENPVRVAARIDLTGWDTTKLYFYSYDPKTGIYKRIVQPEYWIDANGYLHFKTELAGEIVVSEGALTR